jgi:hypothetical protein
MFKCRRSFEECKLMLPPNLRLSLLPYIFSQDACGDLRTGCGTPDCRAVPSRGSLDLGCPSAAVVHDMACVWCYPTMDSLP